MELDALLVQDAIAARDEFAMLQTETEHKRLAYYQAVRRLHSAGASMREVA